ncbi:unnamed protein product [Clavelina lepadiformis]|uniref:Uncharacterized protein n=1 Tax=Clavelina lepadiformis TaxID=159417 RepID=A0ABP0FSG3_CLALP
MEDLEKELLAFKVKVEALTKEKKTQGKSRHSKAFKDLIHLHKLTHNVLLEHFGQCEDKDDVEDDVYEDPNFYYVQLNVDQAAAESCASGETRPKNFFKRDSSWRTSQRCKTLSTAQSSNEKPPLPSLPPPRVLRHPRTREGVEQPCGDLESSSSEGSVQVQMLRDQSSTFSFSNQGEYF